jgi:hypothetical protein
MELPGDRSRVRTSWPPRIGPSNPSCNASWRSAWAPPQRWSPAVMSYALAPRLGDQCHPCRRECSSRSHGSSVRRVVDHLLATWFSGLGNCSARGSFRLVSRSSGMTGKQEVIWRCRSLLYRDSDPRSSPNGPVMKQLSLSATVDPRDGRAVVIHRRDAETDG